MAGDLYYDGPVPDCEFSPLGWCTVCAMIYKGFANATETVKDLVSQVNALEKGAVRRVDMTKLGLKVSKPQPAVCEFMSPILQGVIGQMLGIHPSSGVVAPPFPVKLCWSHLVGLTMEPGGSQLVVASADAIPPEQRGAVDLSRRRSGG